MSRIPPAPVEQYGPLVGVDAPFRQQVFAQAPDLIGPYLEFQAALRDRSKLPPRLRELVRLRVAFHNQCRSCMALRYSTARDDGVTEGLVCSLERPEESDELTEAEKAALEYADRLATDHLSITDETFDRLHEHFDDAEIMELCLHAAAFVGFGRMSASLAMIDDLPETYGDAVAQVAPWQAAPAEIIGAPV